MPDAVRPLAGLKVLDLSEGIAGPFCTKLLGVLGAEVIKAEHPGTGDPARHLPPFYHDEPGLERSGLFLYLNTDKRSITLNVGQPAAQAICRRLVGWADVVVESFKPGALATWGLGYPALEQINPRVVLTSISDFGQDGPYRDYAATDIVALALGGLLYITGEVEREPLKIGGHPAHYYAGLSAFSGTLIAVSFQEATDVGQHVDVSLMEGIAVAQMYSALTYEYRKENRLRVQELGPVFPTKDGHAGVMYRSANWEDFCHLMGKPEMIEDPRFRDAAARRANLAALNALVAPWMKEQSKTELYHTGQALRLPFGYICTPKDLIESPQYRDRNYFIEIDHPATGPLTYPGMPFKIQGASLASTRAPLLGEHNEEVYAGLLGYSKKDLTRLRRQGVV